MVGSWLWAERVHTSNCSPRAPEAEAGRSGPPGHPPTSTTVIV